MKKIPIFIGLIAMLFAIGCDSHKEENHEARTYQVTTPVFKDTSITKEYLAQIHSIRHIELRAMEKGYLQKISVDEGDEVKKGQKMFQIMPNIYQAELQKSKAEAEAASIEYDNTKLLSDSDVVSPNELALAKANFDKAKAEVNLAQTHLGFTGVSAPFDGIMDHLHVREGSMLEEGELLTTLSDNSEMWVYFNVQESEYLDYIMGADRDKQKEVELLLANNKKFNQPGIVETIEGEFDNETGNIAFRATFPNPDGILRHGETGNILMKIPLQHALLIPQKATFEVLDKKYVFVIDENNVLRQKEIKIGSEIQHLFVVKSGLGPKDKILLEGIRLVKNGEKIKYDLVDPEKVISGLDMYAE